MNPNIKYFKKKKIISIDKFFEDVLYNNSYGYYSKNIPFGKNGDFVTAPSISILFGEMLAIWIISFWEILKMPKNFNVVELGPGNGDLAKTLLKSFKKFPKFYENTNFYMYEKSLGLKKIQKNYIKNKKVKWISDFSKIKKGPVLFFGNEFFDAIPIKQFEKKEGLIYEHYVYLDKNNKVRRKLIKIKNKDKLNNSLNFSKNNFIEYPELGLQAIKPMINKIKKLHGGILLIDYGYVKQHSMNTLQSVKNHKKNEIFSNLGKADVTSLVNFNLLKDYFVKKKLSVNNIVSQSFFLKKLGILERAETLSIKMSFKDKADLYLRLKRLLDTKFMGDLFKVIFAYKSKHKNIIGFK